MRPRLGGGLVLAMAMLLSGCGMKEVPREDWGAITPDATIRVTLAGGDRITLEQAFVLTDVLRGFDTGVQEEVTIPLDRIDYIETGSRNTTLAVLTAIAATVSAIAIIEALGRDGTEPPPTEIVNSCPFIYSYDGAGYTLDSETFAGAITKGMKRTDLDNLDHLRPVDGQYRLRLTNERPETQYTDEMTLQVVDHPAGTSVYPDIEGTPRLMEGASTAVTARGLRGADVTDQVAVRDDRFWTGDPVETIDFDDPGSFRDGMELTFPRPTGTRGLLAVRARNTELAPYALTNFLELFGDGLVDWYRQVDGSPELQARLKGWVVREGTLHVSVWQGGEWVMQDVLLDVGPHLAKTQVARLDLAGVEGEEVRVRLEGARGLWTLDWVALGAEAQEAPVVRELAPTVATGSDGRDLARTLAGSDEAYLTTVRGYDVELTYDAPPEPAAGWARSVLARTSGFYHIYVDQTGQPQPEIVERILNEPLFINRYMLGQLLGTRPE